MKKRVIKVSLNERSIDRAIKELNDYKKWLLDKTKEFVKALADEGVEIAKVKFAQAVYDGTNDVSCSVEERGDGKVAVVAVGGATLFIEFGTGVLNPEHPQSSEFGFTHGTYGSGKGANEKGWIYVGEQGNAGQPIRDGVYRTYGNPPAKAMYYAAKDMKAEIYTIAKEVFG